MIYFLAWRLLLHSGEFEFVVGALGPVLMLPYYVELIMTQSVLVDLAIAASLTLNLVVGVHLFRSKRKESTRWIAADGFGVPALLENSPFPDNWVPATEESANPLIEAEVYFNYGRRDDAEAVLASGLREGLISSVEVACLRARLAVK